MNAIVINFMKDLTDENIMDKVNELLDGIKNNYVDNNQCEIMFMLHNRLFPLNQEHTKTCPPCRERVYKRLLSLKNNNE